ncbi:MAG: MBL fold metallo-hydrolase [Actinomycetota bacterium]|nr:MBL fold metallo-hydrolase [Actinomycetota bacterium]
MALIVDQLSLGPIGTNCYIVRADSAAREAVVVDPSGSVDELRALLERREARCVAILLTHGHWDHLVGVADLADATAAPVYMAEGERSLLEDPNRFTPPGMTLRPYTPDVLLHGGETIDVAGLTFDLLSVPGHSPAHIAYHADGSLFSGDVLFAGSVGRTDFPGGDWNVLVASIGSLMDTLPSETVVYPGHGPATTLGDELARNPFLDELRAERTG